MIQENIMRDLLFDPSPTLCHPDPLRAEDSRLVGDDYTGKLGD